MFQKSPEIVYSIFLTVLLANVLILFFGRLLNRFWIVITKINPEQLNLIIILLCVIGCFSIKNSWFDVALCFAFGILGLLLMRYRISPAGVVLGLVLGVILENNFRRMLLLF